MIAFCERCTETRPCEVFRTKVVCAPCRKALAEEFDWYRTWALGHLRPAPRAAAKPAPTPRPRARRARPRREQTAFRWSA